MSHPAQNRQSRPSCTDSTLCGIWAAHNGEGSHTAPSAPVPGAYERSSLPPRKLRTVAYSSAVSTRCRTAGHRVGWLDRAGSLGGVGVFYLVQLLEDARNLGGSVPPCIVDYIRHVASLAARAGASVKMVQIQLGHSDPALTLRLYRHLFEDDLDDLGTRLDEQFGESQSNPSRPGDGVALASSFGFRTNHGEGAGQSARPGGFEPPTNGLEVRRSIP